MWRIHFYRCAFALLTFPQGLAVVMIRKPLQKSEIIRQAFPRYKITELSYIYSAFANSCPHYAWCITAFSRLHLMWAMYNLRLYMKLVCFFVKKKRFEFGYTLVEILQIYTMHNSPHRAQVMTTLLNEIPLTIRHGTVFHFRINTQFTCTKR